jgi:type IV secretory pathway VirB2 component (pilin)
MTGATALQTNILAWLTPIAIILVMTLGVMAMANRMSWGWCIGAPQTIVETAETH